MKRVLEASVMIIKHEARIIGIEVADYNIKRELEALLLVIKTWRAY